MVYWPQGTQNISSATRSQTHTHCIGKGNRNHLKTREVPGMIFDNYPLSCLRFFSLLLVYSNPFISCSMSIESVIPSNYLILFSSCLQSFPASGSFPVSQPFTSSGQSIGASASASVLPMNIQCGFPLDVCYLLLFICCF